MATLYGKTYTRAELLQRVGDIRQLGGVTLNTLADGAGRGVRAADFSTGSGFRFTVLVDRGMDVGAADWAGRPLAWQSGAGVVHPAFYDPKELEWLRSFPGGLMVGCGPDNVGMYCVDEGEELGLHGRLSNTPAELLSYGGEWEGDEYTMWVTGQVRHYRVFGANLMLRRTIRTTLGANHLRIEDMVTNQGYERTPFQILYHCNFGFPVVSRDTELWVETNRSEPRDAEAAKGFDRHTRFEDPTPGYAEQVFLHRPVADESGYARAALVNRALNFGGYVRFRLAELPNLVQWKMMGQGTYVVGLEPANCGVNGRATDRAEGTLRYLEPGETESLSVEIGVLPDAEAIEVYALKEAAPDRGLFSTQRRKGTGIGHQRLWSAAHLRSLLTFPRFDKGSVLRYYVTRYALLLDALDVEVLGSAFYLLVSSWFASECYLSGGGDAHG